MPDFNIKPIPGSYDFTVEPISTESKSNDTKINSSSENDDSTSKSNVQKPATKLAIP